MKILVYFAFLFLALASCNKNEDPSLNDDPTLSDDLTLNVTRAEWYLERMNNGGTVHLILEGTTTGDEMTVRTYGDGAISDKDILLDSNGIFSDDVVISFSVNSVPTGEFSLSTALKVFKKSDKIIVTLTSGKLKY
jgi:hypothetical protein